MTKFELKNGGKLIGKVSNYRAKKLNLQKTAFAMKAVAVKGTDGKIHEGFYLSNKKGDTTPILKNVAIDLEHYVGVTTKRCLCEVLQTNPEELGYVYVNLQTGDISPTFNIVARPHSAHKNDYVVDKDGVIQVVNDDLSMDATEYTFSGKPIASDSKTYTKDCGFVAKHNPSGMYGVVSSFGVTDGAIRVLCPPVFDTSAIGQKTLTAGKYDFLYEYFNTKERVLCDTCYGLALQKVGINEEFRVGDNIQKWRANHPAVEEARERQSKKFRDVLERGEVEPPKKTVIERIKDRTEEIKAERAMQRAANAITDTYTVNPVGHIADVMIDAYPMDVPMEGAEYRRHRHYTPCDYLNEIDDYDMY